MSEFKYKLLIFGTGKSAEKILLNIKKENVEIVGFLDNDSKKVNEIYYEKKIYLPSEVNKLSYDFIVIASVKYPQILKQLQEFGVEEEKILAYFAFKHETFEKYRSLFYMDGIIYDELQGKLERLELIHRNIEYEIADKIEKKKLKTPHVKSIEETIDYIKSNHASISRYGDGEFDLIFEKNLRFQQVDKELCKRLKEILITPIEGHIVGLADVYGSMEDLEEKYADFFRNRLVESREKQYQLLDMNRIYYNAFITRIYSERTDKYKSQERFKQLKDLWRNKEVVIVEGDKSRLGVGNDLFCGTTEIKRVLCPNQNAFEVYEKILKSCLEFSKHKLFILALGPTATVLAYDLAKEGYQALDMGHIDLEYEWFLRKIKGNKVIIEGKYTNEVIGGNQVKELKNEQYEKEIVKIIK